MPDTLHFLISADALAIPEHAASPDDIQNYKKRIIFYSDLYDEVSFKISVDKNTQLNLCEINRWPTWDNVPENLTDLKVDLIKFYNKFCNNIVDIEKYHSIILDEYQVAEVHQIVSDEVFIFDMERLITLVALVNKYCETQELKYCIIINCNTKLISKFEIQVKEFICEATEETALLACKHEVAVCENPLELFHLIEESNLLKIPCNQENLEFAIKVALFKTSKMHKLEEWESLEEKIPLIGNSFLSSYNENFKSKENNIYKKLLKAIVDRVLGDKISGRPHRLRISESGSAKGRRSYDGNLQAMRCDVTQALRLHYWEGPNNKITLDCVTSKHSDANITED